MASEKELLDVLPVGPHYNVDSFTRIRELWVDIQDLEAQYKKMNKDLMNLEVRKIELYKKFTEKVISNQENEDLINIFKDQLTIHEILYSIREEISRKEKEREYISCYRCQHKIKSQLGLPIADRARILAIRDSPYRMLILQILRYDPLLLYFICRKGARGKR